ncbi:O-antigen ligase family protein [Lysobacter sp. GCM10012299]|uniref:O-antigen ligase family protein n=1 Tax=Lysobacter sp. GCM10012299 TaxID=3317333 RepID=UPI00361B331D
MRFKGAKGTPDTAAELAAALLLSAALLAGGGSRGAGDLVVHLAALPALLLAAMRWRWAPASRAQRAMALVCVGAIALAALQLLPLPPSLYSLLPGRETVLADLAQAGQPHGWLPLTLDRWGTVRALLAMMVFTSFWALACTLTHAARLRLLKLALVVATLTALLGYAQSAAGTYSQLRFYDYHHPIGAIGLFANRNHFACLMAMLLPFAIALGVQSQALRRVPATLAWYSVAAMLFLAAALSFSRTGLALACTAALAGLLLLTSRAGVASNLGRIRRWAPLASIAVAIAGIAVYAWDGISQRLQQDPLQDLRWQYLRYGWDAAQAYLPLGSGWGSFKSVYAPFEPVGSMREVFALHAHNDILETLIEAGLPGFVLLLTLLVTVICVTRKNLIDRTFHGPILGAAAIAAFVPLAHSFVDYPLRTHAVAVVFALVLSFLLTSASDAR